MKRILLLLAALATFVGVGPSTAEAHNIANGQCVNYNVTLNQPPYDFWASYYVEAPTPSYVRVLSNQTWAQITVYAHNQSHGYWITVAADYNGSFQHIWQYNNGGGWVTFAVTTPPWHTAC